MKIAFINSVAGFGSTGRIVQHLCQLDGVQGKIYYGRKNNLTSEDVFKMTGFVGNVNHALQTFLFDRHGFCNRTETLRMIEDLKEFDPDLIHLHNLHGYYLDVETLFDYLRQSGKKVIWTLHDCWSFTGHCAHFDSIGCERWKSQCYNCPSLGNYPVTWNGNYVTRNYENKKQVFTSLNLGQLTLVAPSYWLKNCVAESFLNNERCEVISNGIDLSIFRPVESTFRQQRNLENDFLILSVASVWTKEKGFDDLLELSEHLSEGMKIIVVGVTEQQVRKLKKNMIGILRTNSVQELVEIYSACDVFFNPTIEETFSLVNVEAQACGCPVVTYRTGGCPETVCEKTGVIIEKGNVDAAESVLKSIAEGKVNFRKEDCMEQAKKFTHDNMLAAYKKLYEEML